MCFSLSLPISHCAPPPVNPGILTAAALLNVNKEDTKELINIFTKFKPRMSGVNEEPRATLSFQLAAKSFTT